MSVRRIVPNINTADPSAAKPFYEGVLGLDTAADVDACHAAAQRQGYSIVYPLTDEPWGVRRFFVRDPHGVIVNVVSHKG